MILQIDKWFEYAYSDLKTAKHTYNDMRPRELEISCYHSQQCAEKAVKALIIYFGYGQTMPKIHDISFLLNQIKNEVKINEDIYDKADFLSRFATAARYPDEKVSDESQTVLAIKYANEIYDWAKSIVEGEKQL